MLINDVTKQHWINYELKKIEFTRKEILKKKIVSRKLTLCLVPSSSKGRNPTMTYWTYLHLNLLVGKKFHLYKSSYTIKKDFNHKYQHLHIESDF